MPIQYSGAMNYLLKKYPLSVLKQGDVLEGKVLSMEKSRLFVDLGEFGICAIYGAELMKAKNLVNKLKTEDKIYVKVLVVENEDQYVELSPKNAGLETAWEKAEDFMKKQTPVELRAEDANKGGLILNFNELQGFLPTSQLKSEHYPKIESGDKDKILEALKKLVGETFKVTIIDADKDQEKLIFSEKELNSEEINEKISKGKIFLSIKAMEPDPWGEMEKKYKEGDIIAGVVSKLEKYGALINVEQGGIAGLLPKTEKKLELGKNYSFNIESLEPKKQKLILKLNG